MDKSDFTGSAVAWDYRNMVVEYILKQNRGSLQTGRMIAEKFRLVSSADVRAIANWHRRQGMLPAICTSGSVKGYWGSFNPDEIGECRAQLKSRKKSMDEADNGLGNSENKARMYQAGNKDYLKELEKERQMLLQAFRESNKG